jgi:hypothetical protein
VPRDLSDVLHYFLPELEGTPESRSRTGSAAGRRAGVSHSPPSGSRRRLEPRGSGSAHRPLSVLGIPIGERDVVHAAFTWSLAVETARQGGSAVIVAPESDRHSPLWTPPGPGGPEPELVFCPARQLTELRQAATSLAEDRSRSAREGGIVFSRIPPEWLDAAPKREDPIPWLLMFSSPRREDTTATFERVKRWVNDRPELEIGVTIHGVQRVAEARDAFDDLARRCQERLGVSLVSYGLLTDDLDVYRAIAAGRSISETHPDSPAARALADVARLIYEDARSRVLG